MSVLELQPGEMRTLDVSFAPDSNGLARGTLEIDSNDPNQGAYRIHVTATGLPGSGSALHYGMDYVGLELLDSPGAPVLHQISDGAGGTSQAAGAPAYGIPDTAAIVQGVQKDAQLFLDSLKKVETDPSIKDDPKVRDAVDNVNRVANQACGVYNNNSGI